MVRPPTTFDLVSLTLLLVAGLTDLAFSMETNLFRGPREQALLRSTRSWAA